MTVNGKTITPRQLDVWRLIGLGRSRKLIAAELGIKPDTVCLHSRRLYRRLDCHCAADATRLAVQHGVIVVRVLAAPITWEDTR